jgi:hypothetical protein
VQLQQVVTFERLVKTLHQQLRAVAVDGQAAGTFLAAVEQPIAIGALAVQKTCGRLAEKTRSLAVGELQAASF